MAAYRPVMDWNTTEYTFFILLFMFVGVVILELFRELRTTQWNYPEESIFNGEVKIIKY